MTPTDRDEKTLQVVAFVNVYGIFTCHGPANTGLGTLYPTVAVEISGSIIRLTGCTQIIGDFKIHGQIFNNTLDIC